MGLQLPEDLSIVGFDDMQTASYVIPALTTMHQPAYKMGKNAAEVLFQRMEAPSKPVQRMMESTLIIRDSTTSPPHGRTYINPPDSKK